MITINQDDRPYIDTLVEELSAYVRKSDYEGLREAIKSIVIIGLSDSRLSDEILNG